VPRFRPDADGVGDCALHLGEALWKGYNIASDFLVYQPAGPEAVLDTPSSFPHTVTRLDGNGATALNQALDRLRSTSAPLLPLLIHYVSYGYAPGGVVSWLPATVEHFRGQGGRVYTLFHELYAVSRFPSKTFFTSWAQRRVFRRMLSLSDAAFASSEGSLEQMKRENHTHRPVAMIGICSNVGEPDQPPPLAERKRRIAVFGQFYTRKRVYERHLPALLRVARQFDVEEIADIGLVQEPAWMQDRVYGPSHNLVRGYGRLPVAETSALLADSILGVLAYPYDLRWKSGVFAAYQAHAQAILLFPYEGEAQSLDADCWCFSADQLLSLPPNALNTLQTAATSGHNHYQRFRSSRSMAETLFPVLVTKR
jgi:hypothetical protein